MMIFSKLFPIILLTAFAFVSANGLLCYSCFYLSDEALAAELAPVFGLGDSRADCELDPENDTLIEATLMQPSIKDYSVLSAITSRHYNLNFAPQVVSDHCMKANGTINGHVIVLRTSVYFGNDQNGTCVDLEDNSGGLHIIERDCYCSGDACNGANL